MKYEEWIKYEEHRKQMPGKNAWVLLEPDPGKPARQAAPPQDEVEKPRLLSAILQVFNPRGI